MKMSKFKDSQIIGHIKLAQAGEPVASLCREAGIGAATFWKWRSKYGGMDVPMMARIKELEVESRRLKKMCAEPQMDAAILLEAVEKDGEAVSAAGESLSGILWARHDMREDHGYANQEENRGRAGGSPWPVAGAAP